MKRWLLVLGVLALAVALGAFTLYSPVARKKEQLPNPKLFSFAGDDVTEFTIAGPGGSFTLKRTAEQPAPRWEQAAPEKAPVEAAEASFYADQLAGLTADRELEVDHPDLAQYGLTKPELTVTVKLRDGAQHVLYVGAEAPVAMARYVTTDAKNRVYLLSSFTADQLKKKPADFRPQPKTSTPSEAGKAAETGQK
jgi:hypothetical protein